MNLSAVAAVTVKEYQEVQQWGMFTSFRGGMLQRFRDLPKQWPGPLLAPMQ